MSLILRNAKLIDPETDTANLGDLRIEQERITEVGDVGSAAGAIEINCNGACLAPGIIDLGVKVGEPGERHKESFRTAGAAAAAGGVTTIVCRPDTSPAIDTPEVLTYALNRGQASMVHVHQMAALTKGREGREMVEIGFLQDAGALAFTDCDAVVQNTKVLTRALSYARSLDALVIGHPQEPVLSDGAAATSGKFATLRGLPAVSAIAERMGLERDLALVEMTGVRYHADQITTNAGVSVLKAAKARGLNITAGTSIHHVTLNALDVADYRTFFKVKPPLRDENDRLATAQGLADGTIDVLCSMHTPQDEESKRLPFEAAASGATGLETLLPAAMRLVHAGLITLPALWRALSLNPAKLLGIEGGRLAAGARADLVLFEPDAPFVLDRNTLMSKSKNTPFDDARMEGRVLRTFVAGQEVFNREAAHAA